MTVTQRQPKQQEQPELNAIGKKKLKLVLVPSQDGAIACHRMIEPMEVMEEQGLITSKGLFVSRDNNVFQKFVEASKTADILWFECILSQPFLMAILNARVFNPRLKLVMDIDDNIFAINPWNPVFGTFSTEEYYVKGKQMMPIDRNLMYKRLLETFLMETDAILTTTKYLASIYDEYNKNMWYMPNSLWFKHWHLPHVLRRPGDEVRIGWQGGNTHHMDWLQCHIGVRNVLQKQKKVVLEWISCPFTMEKFIEEFPKQRFRISMFKHYDSHSWRHNCLRPDIGLAPLHEDEFSVCKSDLKTSEYLAMGVPVVASNIPPYRDSIIHGETGFLASTPQEWEKYLNLLIQNKELREKMGRAAFKWASEHRCLERLAPQWYDTLLEIWEGVDNQWLTRQTASILQH